MSYLFYLISIAFYIGSPREQYSARGHRYPLVILQSDAVASQQKASPLYSDELVKIYGLI
jgi:hypothetical protein